MLTDRHWLNFLGTSKLWLQNTRTEASADIERSIKHRKNALLRKRTAMAQSGRTPYREDEGIQLATVAETQEELGQVPTATAIATAITTNIPQATAVTNVQNPIWGEQVQGLPPVEPPPLTYQGDPGQGHNTNGNGNNECSDEAKETMCNYFIGLLLFGVVIGVAVGVTYGFDSSSSSRGSPTPFPTRSPPTPFPTIRPVFIAPANAVACPAVFVGGTNTTLSSCTVSGCGGSVQWCGLNDTKVYNLLVQVRGDYDLLSETITLEFDGNSVETSALIQCSSIFETVLNQGVGSSGGELLLTYQTSPSVTAICSDNVFATELRATLSEVD